MSFDNLRNSNNLLQLQQAHIPQKYKKKLQSRALLNHYQEQQLQKMYSERQQMVQKWKEQQLSKLQHLRHNEQMERRRELKERVKNEYSREYEEMIEMKRIRDRQDKEREKHFENKIMNEEKWLLDPRQQKQIEKIKRAEYGKQLERHLKLQEEKRISEANKIKEIRQKLKKDSEQLRKEQEEKVSRAYRNHSMPQKSGQILGVRDALNWSVIEKNTQQDSLGNNEGRPLTPRLQRMLKLQNQKYYGKGFQVQYKSQSQKRYFQRQNPEYKQIDPQSASYNPITNPIPYKYKNPNILKFLSNYS